MKKAKSAVSLFICSLMLLSGCATPSTSLPGKLKAPNPNYPKTISIFAPNFFKNSSAANAKQAKQQWLKEMSARYGTEFNIISEYEKDPRTAATSDSNQESEEQTLGASFVGLMPIDSIGELKSWSEYNHYMPLEDYLENNAIWNALPADFKSLFELDGHIYAIPTSVFKEQYARIIHNEALEETGITVSKTLA
jgi:hypothetical protein